jgi:hypothetical protein
MRQAKSRRGRRRRAAVSSSFMRRGDMHNHAVVSTAVLPPKCGIIGAALIGIRGWATQNALPR